jgi:tRNA(His) 5'-end guanylyltransferase
MERPFDIHMSEAMMDTTKALVEEFKPVVGYTQSDEITVLFLNPEHLFDGRYQKTVSVLAGFCSSYFAQRASSHYQLWDLTDPTPHFDCRVWQVPWLEDALDVFAWREADAIKNSITMAAQSCCSHKQLMGKDSMDKLQILKDKGIQWDQYPTHFKRGVFFKRRLVEKTLTEDERCAIPERNRPSEGETYIRSVIEQVDIPPLKSIPIQNAVIKLFSPDSKKDAE